MTYILFSISSVSSLAAKVPVYRKLERKVLRSLEVSRFGDKQQVSQHVSYITKIRNDSGWLFRLKHYYTLTYKIRGVYILNETSKPPLNIFSYIVTYMIHTWLQFTLNMEKIIKLNLSKFHFHKLKLTCSIDRLYKGTIAFHFHTNAKI